VLLVALLGAFLATTGSVQAHGTGTPTPADGEILRGTPERIVVELPGDEPVTLELRTVAGEVVPFTGEIERVPGAVRALPPVLEYGTYVLEWRSANGDGWSTFSVGKPDAVVSGAGRSPRPIGFVVGAIAALLAALLASRGTAKGSTSRQVSAWVVGSIGVLGHAALAAPPTGVDEIVTFTLLLVGGAGALLFCAGSARQFLAGEGADMRTDTNPGTRRKDLALTITGLAILPAFAVAGVLRNTSVNPFAPASLLAVAAAGLLVAVVIPLGVTRILAKRRGTGRALPSVVALAVFLIVASGATTLEVGARIETLTDTTLPAAACLAGTNRLQIQRCLDASLVATARGESVIAALDTLKRLLGTETRARYFCHEASHAIGRESLKMNGNLADAFRDGYDVCDFGYYHGIVEGAAGGFDDATFLAKVPTLCEEFASAEELFYMQCNHGIGHAAARRTNNDMVRSLAFCDALEQNRNLTGERLRLAQNGCGTGVTMEWFATATADPNAAVTPKVSRPRDVCLAIPERWVPECIEYVGNTLDASAPVESLRELGAWCATTGYLEPCYTGLARAAAGVGIPPRDAIGVCDGAPTGDARNECVTFYIAAVATTIDYDIAAVDRICRELPEADRVGPTSLCEQVRVAVIQVLNAGDGKQQTNRG